VTIPSGVPFSFDDFLTAWKARSMTVTLGAPSSAFKGFATPAFDVRLARGSDSLNLSILVYPDRQAIREDWLLTVGTSPVPKEGRSLPDYISAWWNENVAVVVRITAGDMASDALDAFLSLGGPITVGEPKVVNLSQDGRYLLEPSTGVLLQVPGLLWSPDGKKLAGVGCCVGEGGLDIFDMETGQTRRIYEGDVVGLTWSPDGRRIAFSPYGRRADGLIGANAVAAINADGSGLEVLTEQPGAAPRAWSPDGQLVAFSDQKFTTSPLRIEEDVYVFDLSAQRTIKVSEGVGPAYGISFVSWSSNGSYLAVAGDYRLAEGGPFRSLVYIYSRASGRTVELGESRSDMTAAAWSPDGKSLAFADDDGLFVYDSEAGDHLQLADGPSAGPILWSPDGSSIAFRHGESLPLVGYKESGWQVFYVVPADGSKPPQPLSPARSPSWSPDGAQMAYVSEGCITGDWDVFVAKADGTGVTRLTSSPSQVKEGPIWSSGGTQVVFSSTGALTAVDVHSGEARTLVQYTGEGSHLHLTGGGASSGSPGGQYIGFQIAGGHGVCD
jgi:Tol biopolymer transport system component